MVPLGYIRSSELSPLKFPSNPDTLLANSCGRSKFVLNSPSESVTVTEIWFGNDTDMDESPVLSKKTKKLLSFVSLTFGIVSVMSSSLRRS